MKSQFRNVSELNRNYHVKAFVLYYSYFRRLNKKQNFTFHKALQNYELPYEIKTCNILNKYILIDF